MLAGIWQKLFADLRLDALDRVSKHCKIMYNFAVFCKLCSEITDLPLAHGEVHWNTQLGPPAVVVPGKGGFPKIFVVFG